MVCGAYSPFGGFSFVACSLEPQVRYFIPIQPGVISICLSYTIDFLILMVLLSFYKFVKE
jgi:hypothetical protein